MTKPMGERHWAKLRPYYLVTGSVAIYHYIPEPPEVQWGSWHSLCGVIDIERDMGERVEARGTKPSKAEGAICSKCSQKLRSMG